MGVCCSRAKRTRTQKIWCSWSNTLPIDPGSGLDSARLARFPLQTRGRYIIDSQGERFRLTGINWYGASDCLNVVGGLDTQSLSIICSTIRTLGYNVVRLPFSNEMLRSAVPDGAIDFSKNPQLQDCSALEVFDEVIRCLGQEGIAVILNNHTTYGEFCGPPSQNSLWFDPGGLLSEEQWLDDWVMVAERYLKCPHVVGYDLRNEIRPRRGYSPYWKDGGDQAPSGNCNWARAAAVAAQRLLETNPQALIVVERIVWPQRSLLSYAANPGPLLPQFEGRLILGVHMYQWSGPGRFIPRWAVPAWLHLLLSTLRLITARNYGDLSIEQLRAVALREWGCILNSGVCPVWVSEFGADLANPKEMEWLRKFIDILAQFDADWAYWPLNVGPKPGTEIQEGIGSGDEAYGMLSKEWTPKLQDDERLELLRSVGLPVAGECVWKPKSVSDEKAEHLERQVSEHSVNSRQSWQTWDSARNPLFGIDFRSPWLTQHTLS